jgi:hypothetical protein
MIFNPDLIEKMLPHKSLGFLYIHISTSNKLSFFNYPRMIYKERSAPERYEGFARG